MDFEKLRPCPFCGGEPERKNGYWIECKECGAGVSAPSTDISARGVTARWNARAEADEESRHKLPFHEQTMDGLRALTIRKSVSP